MTDEMLANVARFRSAELPVRAAQVLQRAAAGTSLLQTLSIGWIGVPIVLALTVNALNSKGSLGALVPQPLKAGAVVLAALVVGLVVLRRRVQWRWTLPVVLLLVYAAVITGSTLFAVVPVQRLFLLAAFIGLMFTLIAYDALRPGRALGVLFWTAVVHCVLAVVVNDETLWTDGRTRLEGGSHPIVLGFEATMVFLLASAIVFERHRLGIRVLMAALAAFGVYVEIRAYSREDIIGAVIGIVVLIIALPARRRWLRVLGMIVVLLAVVLPLGVDGIVSLLGADNLQQLSTATGRTTLWQRLFDSGVDLPPTGYGFAALNDGNGPDARLYYATAGTQAENAILQAVLNGGVAGVTVWAVTMIAMFLAVLRAAAPVRPFAWAAISMFFISVAVSSDLAGGGLAIYWLISLVAAATWSRRAATSTDPRSMSGPVVVHVRDAGGL